MFLLIGVNYEAGVTFSYEVHAHELESGVGLRDILAEKMSMSADGIDHVLCIGRGSNSPIIIETEDR